MEKCCKYPCTLPVINKKYKLCKRHNWERMNPTKDYFQEMSRKVHSTQEKMLSKQRLKPKKIYKFNPKPSGPIKARSTKRQKQEQEYKNKNRPEYLLDKPICEVCLIKPSDQIHHKKGRIGDLLNDKNFFLATCDDCHKKIERKPKWAYSRGYSISRII